MQTAIAYLLALILFIHSSMGWTVERSSQNDDQSMDNRRNALRQLETYRSLKTAHNIEPRAHNIEPRALREFKNCYFSPIQCVLVERRRR